jgi:hypothetical protein
MKHSLKEIVKDNMANFDYINQGKVYYRIIVDSTIYQLEIDSMDDEWKNIYIKSEYKAITLMRWIRKGMNNDKFVQLN